MRTQTARKAIQVGIVSLRPTARPAGSGSDDRSPMARLPQVRLDLSNRPENVLLVRETLTGVAEAVGLDASDLSDIRTAVTEAANNVVLHAYNGGEGPLEVEIYVDPGALRVIVRDHGVGLSHEPGDAGLEPGAESGIGLPVIEALSQEVDFAKTPEGGTEVRMTFGAPGVAGQPSPSGEALSRPVLADAGMPGDPISVSVHPPELARAVVPRLLAVLAARAHFSTDRISDSQLLADALVAHAARAVSGTHLGLAVSAEPRDLHVRVGPLVAGHAERLVLASDVEGLGQLLTKLADGHGVSSTDAHDTLTLRVQDRAGASS
jgi:serine/threonine-protein kinase RsbW